MLLRLTPIAALLLAALQQLAFAQYIPPNPGSCASGFTYSAGVCLPRVVAAMPTSPPILAVAVVASPIRPGCACPAVEATPMPTGRPIPAPAPVALSTPPKCACRAAEVFRGPCN